MLGRVGGRGSAHKEPLGLQAFVPAMDLSPDQFNGLIATKSNSERLQQERKAAGSTKKIKNKNLTD